MAYRELPLDLQNIDVFPIEDLTNVQSLSDAASSAYASSTSYGLQTRSFSLQFKSKRLQDWSKQDVQDFLYSIYKTGYSPAHTQLSNCEGLHLVNMSQQQFLDIDPLNGHNLHRELLKYKRHKMSGGRLISEKKSVNQSLTPLNIYDTIPDLQLLGHYEPLRVDVTDYAAVNAIYPLSPSTLMNHLTLESATNSHNSLSPSHDYSILQHSPSDYFHTQNSYGASPSYDSYRLPLNESSESLVEYCDDTDLPHSHVTDLTQDDLEMLEMLCAVSSDLDIGVSSDREQSLLPHSSKTHYDTDQLLIPESSSSLSQESPDRSPRYSAAGYPCGTYENPQSTGQLSTGSRGHTNEPSTSHGSLSPRKQRSSPRSRTSSSQSTLTRRVRVKSGGSSAVGGRKVRGKKVWEFLLDLLQDPQTNPSLIRWENESKGEFRLVEHEIIAQKWGERRNRADLSYDYFARTLRYQYSTRKLESVPERKLVYKFGKEVMEMLRRQRRTNF